MVEAPWAPPPLPSAATVCSVCFVSVVVIPIGSVPCAGVDGDAAVEWSAGLGSVVPASLNSVPESRFSFAVLVLASAVVTGGFCH